MTLATKTEALDQQVLIDAHALHAGFVRQAHLTPGNDALVVADRTFTYAEADDMARRLAAGLLEAVGHRPRRVAIFGARSAVSYLGALGALLAGAAFVPLNPKFPIARTRAMLEQADVDAIIVDAHALPQLHEVLRGLDRTPALLLPAADASTLARRWPGAVLDCRDLANLQPLSLLPTVTADDLAYLLFTSGSTGVPSGVPITHGNARAFLDVNAQRYQLGSQDRVSQTFDQTFDLSVFDLFMAWDAGACVCAMQPIELLAPFKFLQQHRITVWFSVPSVAALLIKRGALKPGSMPTLRWSLFCGEGLPKATAEAWQKAAPNSIVENLYGPTELTIACTAYRWNPVKSPAECVNDLVPIGDVYTGLDWIIVDEELVPVGPGAIGELCVAGAQTSPGYWRNAERTAQRFIDRIQPNGCIARYHRTGDLVARRDGGLVYFGRRDTQIKVGGHRIELGEIEGVLRRGGSVEAVALAWPCAQQPDHIVAIVSGASNMPQLEAAARQSLPNYMVPRAIHTIAEMPLNANSKIDRKALRQWLASRPVAELTQLAG
ncbi:MAG: amino acid adenylation domain-containing protein [Hyphomicrobiaceae bacterium]